MEKSLYDFDSFWRFTNKRYSLFMP